MYKKLQKLFIIALIIIGIGIIVSPTPSAQAVNYVPEREGGCPDFLGLTSWDCGVTISDEESLKSGIWLIASNVLTDITIVGAYLVLGYVIYGGYLYVLSGGDTGKVATGKKTLTQAFIGLAIVMSASVILNSIRIALMGSNGSFAKNCAVSRCVNPTSMINRMVRWVIGMIGVVSSIFVVYGGITYITSNGDPGKIKKAKDAILYALIGLAIVGLSEVILAFVTNTLVNANNAKINPETLNEIAITKELYEKK